MSLHSLSDLSEDLDDAEQLDLDIFLHLKKMRMMSMDHSAVAHLSERVKIKPFYDFVTTFNSANDAPYHNLYHTRCVFLNCYEGGWYEQCSESEVKSLLVAALFHDFDHSAGKEVDEVNISRAVQGLESAQRLAAFSGQGLTQEEFQTAINIIKVTKYPWDQQPKNLVERIMRDADLMQVYEEREIPLIKQYEGLFEEVAGRKITDEDRDSFAQKLQAFNSDQVVWYTDWAKKKASHLDFQQQVKQLTSLIS